MIEIHPNIRNIYHCPRCNDLLSLDGFAVSGMRNVVSGKCVNCGHEYYADIPVGHALYYPAMIDKHTFEVFSVSEVTWFKNNLKIGLKNKSEEYVPLKVIRFFEHKEVVLVNCLDLCYGHSFCKLLSTQYYLDHVPNLGCCVLIPRQLRHLVPEGVAEIWEVDLPFKKMATWYTSLETQIGDEIRRKERCYLSLAIIHLHPTFYSIDRFAKRGDPQSINLDGQVVVFSYREDRLWGPTLRAQHANILSLYRYLAQRYEPLSFVLIGFGTDSSFPDKITDRRTSRFDPHMEAEWVNILYRANGVVGVHGSNMHLPTALAQNVVELLPQGRYGNAFLDYTFNVQHYDPLENMWRFRLIYGDRNLRDVSPQTVADVLISQMDGWHRFKGITGITWPKPRTPGKEIDPLPIVEYFQQFNHTPFGFGHNSSVLQRIYRRSRFEIQKLLNRD